MLAAAVTTSASSPCLRLAALFFRAVPLRDDFPPRPHGNPGGNVFGEVQGGAGVRDAVLCAVREREAGLLAHLHPRGV